MIHEPTKGNPCLLTQTTSQNIKINDTTIFSPDTLALMTPTHTEIVN